MNGKIYSLPRETWVTYEPTGNKCVLKVIGNNFEKGKEFWVLGTSFMKSFDHILFDVDEMKVGLVNKPGHDPIDARVPVTVIDILKYVALAFSVVLIGVFSHKVIFDKNI